MESILIELHAPNGDVQAAAVIPEEGEIIRYGMTNLLPPLNEEYQKTLWANLRESRKEA